MEPEKLQDVTRRHFLAGSGLGLGVMALSTLSGQAARADIPIDATQPLAERGPHFAPRAKRVIY
jgi:hypothetical protein